MNETPAILQPIAKDTGDFPELRSYGCVYVDKTAYFHRLITSVESRRYFIARPRRFGKSLMISTLKAIFEGRRELFDGLAISRTNWKWEKYPVLYLNMGFASASTADEFRQSFSFVVRKAICEAGGKYEELAPPAINFGMAIDSLPAANTLELPILCVARKRDDGDVVATHARAACPVRRAEARRRGRRRHTCKSCLSCASRERDGWGVATHAE